MMRIAFVSDMHGNLPAFEAVLADLDRGGPFDGIYGGGDFVLGGLEPGECIQKLIDLGWECVRGNAEELVVDIATDGAVPVQNWPPEVAESESFRTLGRWTAERLDDAQIAFLRGLQVTRALTGPGGQSLMLVHATPWSTHDIIWQDDPDENKRQLLDRARTDALLYGHIHYPYQQELDGRTLCCAGAVSLPFDGDRRACYAIATDAGDGWRFEHVRVAYDHEAYANRLEASEMPGGADSARTIRSATR